MIEYAKKILPKVCNWKELFRKELIKSVKWAGSDNRDEIFSWCYRHYSDSHSDVLEEVFPGKIKKALGYKRVNRNKKTTEIAVCKNPDIMNTPQKRLTNQVQNM